jgi:hypothetical protein
VGKALLVITILVKEQAEVAKRDRPLKHVARLAVDRESVLVCRPRLISLSELMM